MNFEIWTLKKFIKTLIQNSKESNVVDGCEKKHFWSEFCILKHRFFSKSHFHTFRPTPSSRFSKFLIFQFPRKIQKFLMKTWSRSWIGSFQRSQFSIVVETSAQITWIGCWISSDQKFWSKSWIGSCSQNLDQISWIDSYPNCDQKSDQSSDQKSDQSSDQSVVQSSDQSVVQSFWKSPILSSCSRSWISSCSQLFPKFVNMTWISSD